MSDVVVMAVDDHYLGKVPAVYFVNQGPPEALKSLKREIKTVLPRSHLPSKYIAVKEVSRSPSGKVIKSRLIDPDNLA